MFSPGSKAWIKKYFRLVEEKKISLWENIDWTDQSIDLQIQEVFGKSGMLFGHPNHLIFTEHIDQKTWTKDERFEVLLFESLLLVYLNFTKGNFHAFDFQNCLLEFYEHYEIQFSKPILNYLIKEDSSEKLERYLGDRCENSRSIAKRKTWFGTDLNAFAYLDVLLFEEFLNNGSQHENSYQNWAKTSLGVICLAASADDEIDTQEKQLFDTFLVSASLRKETYDEVLDWLEYPPKLEILLAEIPKNESFQHYLFAIAILTIETKKDNSIIENAFLKKLQIELKIDEDFREDTELFVEQFILEQGQNVRYLSARSSTEQMANYYSRRWLKILGRNKDKLALELNQSKELVALIRKSMTEELSKEEKEKVKTQFMDIVKSMPALAIFLLPGGAILLPLVLKVIPTLVPSAFRDND